jgi:hypothetical protein
VFVLEIVDAIEKHVGDLTPPFIVAAERKADDVRIRVRQLPTP